MKREKFNKKMQQLMLNAWILVKTQNFTISEAMKKSWKNTSIKNRLASGVIEFSYRKKDGSIRNAKGTTNMASIPAGSTSFVGGYSHTDRQIRYFDLDVNSWRSFNIDNLLVIK